MSRTEIAGLRAVVFDWAGTLFDFGSLAPMGAFVELFARHGVAITVTEARVPMGLPKWEHIQAVGQLPRVAAAWRVCHGHDLDDSDVDKLFAEYGPMNAAAVAAHANLVPGALDTVASLRARGILIGSTTGYDRHIMNVALPLIAEQGLRVDCVVCADDVAASRPSPLALYRCLLDLGVWPLHRVIKVDDTVPGLLEGRNAGCWTVAVTASGNEVGLSLDDWRSLDEADRQQRLASAHLRLSEAQPDYVIASVASLMPVVAEVEARLARGERPRAAA